MDEPRAPLHVWRLPHNISGTGRITGCPKECPAHEDWLGIPLDALDAERRTAYLSDAPATP